MNEAELKKAILTDDAFLGGKVQLLQPKKGVRAGIDAVFLAACVPAKSGETVLEAGIGSGAASLCLAARVPGLSLTGVELNPEAASLARRNAERNGFSDQLKIIEADVTAKGSHLAEQGIAPDSFDHVLANPPYYENGRGNLSPLPGKAEAHAHGEGDLQSWITFLIRSVKPRGTITFVHRPDVLGEILLGLEGRAGDVTVCPLYPRADAPAHRVLVQAVKANRAPFRLLPGLALQGSDGKYCPSADAVLRHGAPFPLKS